MNILVAKQPINQPISNIFDIMYYNDDQYLLDESDAYMLNDSLIRLISRIDKCSWNDAYEKICNFSLKKKYKGRLYADSKIARDFLIEKYGLNEIKIKGKMNMLQFMCGHKEGRYILLLDMNGESYCVCYIDGEFTDSFRTIALLNKILLENVKYVMTSTDQEILPEAYKNKNGKYRIKSNYSSMLDLLKLKHVINNNLLKTNISDCVIRSISYITGKSWEYTYKKLNDYAIKYNKDLNEENIFSTAKVIHKYIIEELKYNYIELDSNSNISRIKFMNTNREGKFILISKGHMFVYDNGVYI